VQSAESPIVLMIKECRMIKEVQTDQAIRLFAVGASRVRLVPAVNVRQAFVFPR